VNPDLSDSEFIEREEIPDAPTPGLALSDAGDGHTTQGGAEDDDDEEEESDGGDGDIDEEFAAELDLALGDEAENEADEDDEEESEDEEDEDEDEDETSQSKRLLNEEIRDLESAVAKKRQEIASSANPLIKVLSAIFPIWNDTEVSIWQRRFEDALKKLQGDLEMKLVQREEMDEQQRGRKPGYVSRGVSEPNENGEPSAAE